MKFFKKFFNDLVSKQEATRKKMKKDNRACWSGCSWSLRAWIRFELSFLH